MAATDAAKGYRNTMYSCSTPHTQCNGRKVGDRTIDNKYHSSSEECLACTKRYMLLQGYTAITSRQFDPGDGGPVVTFPKHAQRLKPGKNSNSYMAQPLKVRNSAPPPKNK